MFRLFKFLSKKDYLKLFFAVVLIVLQVWLDLRMPDYMSDITVLAQTEGSEMSEILKNGGFMLACAGGSLVAMIAVGYLAASISANFAATISRELFMKVERLGLSEIQNFSTSSLITRTTNDVSQVQMFIAMGTQLLIKSPITAVWAITKILGKNWQWSAMTAGAVGILLVAIILILIFVLPKFKKVQKLTDKLNGITRENLSGIRVVRAFNAEKYQENKFNQANSNLAKTQLFTLRAFAVLSPLMYLVIHFLVLFIYVVGAYLIDAANMLDKISIFGDMVVFSSYAMQVIMSFLMLAMVFMIMPRAEVSAKRINEVLDTKEIVKDGSKTVSDVKSHGSVDFKNVSFSYGGAKESVLEDISFSAKAGETVAFIGATGSGKSTLVNLIPRFFDATKGQVLVDGIDVREYKQSELRNLIGYVSQKAVLFDGTIKSNIKYGDNGKPEAKDDKILKALDVAQAKDFVLKMPEKLDAHVAEGGTNYSGGQKQRLSIARAIARDPEIYIFDDTFSALDYKTDAVLRKELKKYTKNATVLIVAQRIGTIMNADKIIVLEDGKCAGIGKHKELLRSCPVYRQIAESQLSPEELKNA